MPLPRRSIYSTRRTPAPTVPRGLMPALREARETIAAQQQAIMTLQSGLAALSPRGPAGAPTPRVPPSAAPEKCELQMSPATFRSWRRSIECWLHLCRCPPQEAVHHIRLHCVPALQCAVDARLAFDCLHTERGTGCHR
ncbi:hypothetical protein GWK47_027281 [Chionoecetes opilio]|uniref:Uncharacterized protein n=1 Tax=Chionoecetes opilio TaxID=41210 RepID=A0A8J8WCP5_CHIOP|nr:hypothetical protein GWK47_027281 [Chionoecetes opilio]